MTNSFTVLFDYDSLIYKSVHKICSISDIRGWFKDGKTKAWMENEIVNLSLNRLSQMDTQIFQDIEDTGINIDAVEYFLTACYNSIRKKESPIYKANRKKNKKNRWVNVVRRELLKMDGFIVNEFWEADDLIADRAVELGEGNYIVCSPDKDLKQIPGIRFDYYRPILKNEDGTYPTDENGFRIAQPCRGLDIMTKEEANKFLAIQLLMGDSGDGVKGIPKIGEKKAAKIIEDVKPKDYRKTVLSEYVKYFGKDEGQKQFDLHLLLLGLGIEHREFLT